MNLHKYGFTGAQIQHLTNKNKNRAQKMLYFYFARRQGFEPRFFGPEPNVLPLDDLRII